MFTFNVKTTLTLMAVLLLSACSSHQAVNDTSKPVLSNDWRITGKLALIGPQQRLAANVTWLHLGTIEVDELRLVGPLGISLMSLDSQPGLAQLQLDGEQYQSHSADDLILRLSGWPLPLSQLSRYLVGQISPQDAVTYDAQGQLASVIITHPDTGVLSQIRYLGWQDLSGHIVPTQLELQQGSQLLKLAINSWVPESL
ncbi:MAG: lipoprotein insertase outer membrane protein LolB [Ferrimonas sp.]